MITRATLPCRTRALTCCTGLMSMTHGNISVMGFPWKARWKEDVKRLILNTRGFTFPNRRKLLQLGKTELMETSHKCVFFCTCEQECLIKGWPRETHLMIQQLRQRLFWRNYNKQNYILTRQMEVKVCPSGVRKITYNVLPLGKVCRDAFQKCYGISNAKINVLLKKMDVDGVSIQPDMRGRHEHKTTKLLQKREVR